MSDLLYNLPQELWDDLCNKAEDFLYEEKIGNHIVGLYPTGPRLQGTESESPQILCLYLDSVDSLLDPLKDTIVIKRTMDLALSKVIFIEFGLWIRLACSSKKCEEFYLVPLWGDCFFEDETVASIIDLVDQYKTTKDEKFLTEISKEAINFYKVLL